MCPTVEPFLEFSLEEWEETMDNNAKSTFLMCRLVLPGMPVRGKGAPSFPSMDRRSGRNAPGIAALYVESSHAPVRAGACRRVSRPGESANAARRLVRHGRQKRSWTKIARR